MNFDTRRALTYLALGFLLLSIWNNPGGTASSFGDFLGDIGSWIEDAIDKGTEFFRGLFES